MLHVIHCIQSGCFGPCCIKSTAFNHAARNPLHSIGMHFTRLHGIHCIQSRCMESTAFNHAAWNPLHSIRMHFNKLHGIHSVITLHGLRCIQSGSITPQCMESSAFNHAAWNPLHSIGMQFTTLNGVHCIQSCCMESPAFNLDALGHAAKKSTAFNRDALGLAAWTPLHTIGIHCTTMHGIFCIQ